MEHSFSIDCLEYLNSLLISWDIRKNPKYFETTSSRTWAIWSTLKNKVYVVCVANVVGFIPGSDQPDQIRIC